MTRPSITLERPIVGSKKTIAPGQFDNRFQPTNPKSVPWYAGLLCRVGLHWGKWEYVAEKNCSQILVCGRCSNTRLRIKHQREWGYIREGSCEQVRTCQRCQAESGHRTRHRWGQATYTGDTGSHTCQRCGRVEEWSTYTG